MHGLQDLTDVTSAPLSQLGAIAKFEASQWSNKSDGYVWPC